MVTVRCRNPRRIFLVEVNGESAVSSDIKYQTLVSGMAREYSPAYGDPECWISTKIAKALGGEIVEGLEPADEALKPPALSKPKVYKSRYSITLGKKRRPHHVGPDHPLILSAKRNQTKIKNAWVAMIEQVKRELDMNAMSTALLHKDWGEVMRLADIKQRMVQVSRGHGLKHGVLSFRDALRQTYYDGAKIGVGVLDKIPTKVRKADSIAMSMSFDALNPAALDFLNQYEMNLITNVSADTQASIHDIIVEAFQTGGHPYEQARQIRDLIGLDPQLETAVDNFRTMLENGDNTTALTRALRDRRFDSTLENNPILDNDQIDNMVDRYASRALDYRAERIARTESLRASNQGQKEAWNQAVQQGYLDTENTVQIVLLGPDPCNICEDIAAMNDEGVGIDETFDVPDDASGDYMPFHPHCLCVAGIRLLSGPMSGSDEEE